MTSLYQRLVEQEHDPHAQEGILLDVQMHPFVEQARQTQTSLEDLYSTSPDTDLDGLVSTESTPVENNKLRINTNAIKGAGVGAVITGASIGTAAGISYGLLESFENIQPYLAVLVPASVMCLIGTAAIGLVTTVISLGHLFSEEKYTIEQPPLEPQQQLRYLDNLMNKLLPAPERMYG